MSARPIQCAVIATLWGGDTTVPTGDIPTVVTSHSIPARITFLTKRVLYRAIPADLMFATRIATVIIVRIAIIALLGRRIEATISTGAACGTGDRRLGTGIKGNRTDAAALSSFRATRPLGSAVCIHRTTDGSVPAANAVEWIIRRIALLDARSLIHRPVSAVFSDAVIASIATACYSVITLFPAFLRAISSNRVLAIQGAAVRRTRPASEATRCNLAKLPILRSSNADPKSTRTTAAANPTEGASVAVCGC